jgi:hypothetical protein
VHAFPGGPDRLANGFPFFILGVSGWTEALRGFCPRPVQLDTMQVTESSVQATEGEVCPGAEEDRNIMRVTKQCVHDT